MNPQLTGAPQETSEQNDWMLARAIQCLRTRTAVCTLALSTAVWATAVHADASNDFIHNAAYTVPEVSTSEITSAFPDMAQSEAEALYQDIVQKFIKEVQALQAEGKNIIPGTDGETVVDVLSTLSERQFSRVIGYYASVSNHPDSAAMEAIVEIVPELGTSRIDVDTFIDYLEDGMTGYDVMLEEEWISPEEANISPRQFYTIGQILKAMYPSEGEKVADVLYELVFNDVGEFKPGTYAFMTAEDADGKEYLPLLEVYARVIPDHFQELYEVRFAAYQAEARADENIAAAEARADEAEARADENIAAAEARADENIAAAEARADEAEARADAIWEEVDKLIALFM